MSKSLGSFRSHRRIATSNKRILNRSSDLATTKSCAAATRLRAERRTTFKYGDVERNSLAGASRRGLSREAGAQQLRPLFTELPRRRNSRKLGRYEDIEKRTRAASSASRPNGV